MLLSFLTLGTFCVTVSVTMTFMPLAFTSMFSSVSVGGCWRFHPHPLLLGEAGLRRMSASLQPLVKSTFRVQRLSVPKYTFTAVNMESWHLCGQKAGSQRLFWGVSSAGRFSSGIGSCVEQAQLSVWRPAFRSRHPLGVSSELAVHKLEF